MQKRRMGFAAMDPEQQRTIAKKGGKAAHEQGVAHEWNQDQAREAGKKGGQKISQNKEHMAAIGRKGGEASRKRSANKRKEFLSNNA